MGCIRGAHSVDGTGGGMWKVGWGVGVHVMGVGDAGGGAHGGGTVVRVRSIFFRILDRKCFSLCKERLKQSLNY